MSSTRFRLMLVLLVGVLGVRLAWAGGSRSNPVRAAKTTGKTRDFTDKVPCIACHTTDAWRVKGAAVRGQKFDHSKTGFPLTGAHITTPCVDCHTATQTLKRACVSCHEDFHRGRLSQSCDNCHSAAGWRVTRPLEIHRFTRFPLTGMHVLADCSECHRRASEQRWTDAPIACFACHEKEYRRPGIFPIHAGSPTSAPLPRDCSLCHRALAWVPAIPVVASSVANGSAPLTAPRNHDLRFPISFGAHRSAACADCHSSMAAPRAVRCIGCHAHDPSVVTRQHRRPVATDGPACLNCHLAGARR